MGASAFWAVTEKKTLSGGYDEIQPMGFDLLRTRAGEIYGLMDLEGTELVPPKYDWIDGFYEVPASMVRLDGKCGLIDTKGMEIVLPIYDFSDMRARKVFITPHIVVSL